MDGNTKRVKNDKEMKRILTVDVQEKDGKYTFTLDFKKKITTVEVNSLSEGFRIVQELINGKNPIRLLFQENGKDDFRSML